MFAAKWHKILLKVAFNLQNRVDTGIWEFEKDKTKFRVNGAGVAFSYSMYSLAEKFCSKETEAEEKY